MNFNKMWRNVAFCAATLLSTQAPSETLAISRYNSNEIITQPVKVINRNTVELIEMHIIQPEDWIGQRVRMFYLDEVSISALEFYETSIVRTITAWNAITNEFTLISDNGHIAKVPLSNDMSKIWILDSDLKKALLREGQDYWYALRWWYPTIDNRIDPKELKVEPSNYLQMVNVASVWIDIRSQNIWRYEFTNGYSYYGSESDWTAHNVPYNNTNSVLFENDPLYKLDSIQKDAIKLGYITKGITRLQALLAVGIPFWIEKQDSKEEWHIKNMILGFDYDRLSWIANEEM